VRLSSGLDDHPERDRKNDRAGGLDAERSTRVAAIVLDVEGTTTPVSFVYDVLFPYARAHLRSHLRAEAWRARAAGDGMASAREQATSDADEIAARMEAMMDADSKDSELKRLQGAIWDSGYRSGTLRGEVFADVPPAFARWRRAGLSIAIYSSGSVRAQQLLFGSTRYGDLTPFIARHFDTGVGAKRDAASYERIAVALDAVPREILFVSDVSAELDAARAAGWQTALCTRQEGTSSNPPYTPSITSFDELSL
jgi:enolase-phosphatase E1